MKTTLTSILILVLANLAMASPVGVYVNDTFSGGSLDTNVWNSYVGAGASVTVAGGNLTLTSPGNWSDYSGVNSKATVKPDAGQTVILASTGMTTPDWSIGAYWGLEGDANNSILIYRDNTGQGNSSTVLNVKVNGTNQATTLMASNTMNGAFTILWSQGGVAVEHNGSLLFDSAVSAPYWALPGTAMRADFMSWGNSTLTISDATLEVVPEPATMLLLGLGGLAFLRRRK